MGVGFSPESSARFFSVPAAKLPLRRFGHHTWCSPGKFRLGTQGYRPLPNSSTGICRGQCEVLSMRIARRNLRGQIVLATVSSPKRPSLGR